jgi:DNA-binding CsgD family transcriptional regulator
MLRQGTSLGAGLVGRAKECGRIDDLLDFARHGLSEALVVRGETGMGKTALLDYAAEQADGFRVVRLTGVESERELGYAALHQFLHPMLDRVRRLPPLQREALDSALGLAAGPPANPFLVGLGVISVAADVARADGRLLCLIDDAQWLDSESLGALAFWGRRLQADRIAVIFGERSGTLTGSPLQDLPALEVSGLERDAARALLVSEAGFELDRDVADRVLAETEGNPLAIIEVAKGLTPHELVGSAAAPDPLPLTRRLEERFAGQVRALSLDTRMFLLLVAADTSADAALVSRAADRLEIGKDAAEAAEEAGLVLLGPPVTYRHPLIRSAVYGAASPADRRAVHDALAAATDPADAERWAWHRAGATLRPKEEVAALLENCAARSLSNGATSAAVALLSRAAELTPDREHAAERRVAAAEAAVERGLLSQTQFLVDHAAPALRDPAWQARAKRVSGLVDLREGNLLAAACRLRDAAAGLLPGDAVLGRRTLVEAVDIAVYCGDAAQSEFMRSVAASDAHSAGAPSSVADHLLHAFSTHAREGYAAAVPEYHRAIALSRDTSPQELAPWASLIAAATRSIWDYASHDLLLQRVADWSRARGSLFPLWLALFYLASSAEWSGQHELRSALFDQAADVLSITGQFAVPRIGAPLAALRGQEAEVLAEASATLSDPDQRANAFAANNALLALQIGRAQYRDALGSALLLFDADPMMAGPHLLPDMVEAAVRVGDTAAAEKAMARLAERATAAGTPWALALLARSQGLLAGAAAEAHFTLALELFSATPLELQRARTHLLYGEWLRRAARHIDARDHLRRAHDMLIAMGAEDFAERARVELLATGERARKRTVENSDDLTPQEAQISLLVGKGASNREIAAQLFVSQSTVEYHLHKVFRKLGVKSRTQLARRVLESRSVAGLDLN